MFLKLTDCACFYQQQALNTNDNNSKEAGWMDRLKKASFKDLCNEDKKRIADLIRELARYMMSLKPRMDDYELVL